jgi:hypothetical protein
MIFKKFEPTRSTASGAGIPTVRVRSEGRMILNAAAQRQLAEVEFVQLLWDEETERFGFQATDEADPARLRIVHAASQAIVTSREFVQAHNLPLGQRMRLVKEGDLWVASTSDVEPTQP